MSFQRDEIGAITGLHYYEDRALWQVLAANDDRRVILVTSRPVADVALRHLLSRAPRKHLWKRNVHFVSVDDDGDVALSEKILRSPQLIERIKSLVEMEGRRAQLVPYVVSDRERQLAWLLNARIVGPAPHLDSVGTKSGARGVFEAAGIPYLDGLSGLRTEDDVRRAIFSLSRLYPDCPSFLLKLDRGLSGLGNAILNVPQSGFAEQSEVSICVSLRHSQSQWHAFIQRLEQTGGVLEVFVPGNLPSPSGQGFIHENGFIEMLSTHEQLLRGEQGQSFAGASFPCDLAYREQVQMLTEKVGSYLYSVGGVGPFSVDFVAVDRSKQHFIRNGPSCLAAVEINFRQGGTTHLLELASHLAAARYDRASGNLCTANGIAVFYTGSDSLNDQLLRGLKPEILVEYLSSKGLLFNAARMSGCVVHLLSMLEPLGQLGLLAMGASEDEAHSLFYEARQAALACARLYSQASKPEGETVASSQPETVAESSLFIE